MNHIDGKQDRLTVLILFCLIGFDNQFVTGSTISHLLCDLIRQYVQVLNAFPSINAKRVAVFFIGIKAFKNWFCKNLSVNQFFQTNLVCNADITMNNSSITDSVGIDFCQQALFFLCGTERSSSQANQLQVRNFGSYIVNDFAISFRCRMMGFVYNQIQLFFALDPLIQALDISSDTVLADDQQIVARTNITGSVMAGCAGDDSKTERRDVRNNLCIGKLLERLGSLIQQHLTVGNPKNFLFLINGVLQEPHRSGISLTTAGRKNYQRTVRCFLIHLVQRFHCLFLMFIRRSGVCAFLGENITI